MTTQPDQPDHLPDEPMDVEAPRRAASAQFIVEPGLGDQAALREAMDPANQSLAEALRLSYRVLQVVIVVLVIMFLISGVKIVEQGQSGVMLRFGKIVQVKGSDALEPGRAWSLLPYPAADFVTFDIEGLRVDMSRVFWPQMPPNSTEEQAIDRARTTSGLRPGRDGSLVTRDGDLAHAKITANYEIADPVLFVETLSPLDAERMIRAAVQRAVVQVAARLELAEIVEISDSTREDIRNEAQRLLDRLRCGIELKDVTVGDAKPPFAVVKAYGQLQNAREEARRAVESSRQAAEQALIALAGPHYRRLAALIDAFEDAHEQGDGAIELAAVNDFLDGNGVGGAAEEQIQRAKAYESRIELTLGSEVKRFHALLPAYEDRPVAVIKQQWLETIQAVLSRSDTEIFYVPAGAGSIKITVSGSEDIAKIRAENRIRARREQVFSGFVWDRTQRAEDLRPGQSQPLLEVQDGRIAPRLGNN